MDRSTGAPPASGPASGDQGPVPGVPAVVAVVVTHDPGSWLEETLAALAAQDYPNLSVLLIDACSAADPTPRVAAVLPAAYVRRLEGNPGFGAAANDVLDVVEGASHYVFLHDDAAPDPDAIRLLVEESFRSNAGVVAPKLVGWDDPRCLLAVGAAADRTGSVTPYGRFELDQEQHDAVRDVFVAPGGCTLVRADLFKTLRGFDSELALFGEDLDLSWRAQVVGARVVVAPAARVRHREATVSGQRAIELSGGAGPPAEQAVRLQLRHRLRAVLKAYGPLNLLLVLPHLALVLLGQAAFAAVSGRTGMAAAHLDTWRWNFERRSGLWEARRRVQSQRALRDREVRRLQVRGSSRFYSALRDDLGRDQRVYGIAAAGRRMAGAVTAGGSRQNLVVWLGVAAVLVLGTRGLLAGSLPSVGQLSPFPDSPFTFLRAFLSGWRTSGLGAEAPAPFAFALLGLGGILLGGAMGLLQKIVVLGAIPVGVFGAYRLAAPVGSWRGRVVGGVLYAALPLPYDALAQGRWSGMLAYAAAPWLLARLLRATGMAPFGAPVSADDLPPPDARRPPARRSAPPDAATHLDAEAATHDTIRTEELRVAMVAVAGRPEDHRTTGIRGRSSMPPVPAGVTRPGSLRHQAMATGLLLAVVAAFVPLLLAVAVIMGVALALGGVVVGKRRPKAPALVVACGAVAVAVLLLLPWTFEIMLPGATWAGFTGLGRPPSAAPAWTEILRFAVGPIGDSPLGWGLLVAAALPLIFGRRWRFSWAGRLWVMACLLWALAWLAARGWAGVSPPPLEVLLAPAGAALVLAAVLGLAAFEIDLPGYQFGLRQGAFLVAAVAAVASTLPVIFGALDGRWNLPGRDFAGVLSWMPERRSEGSFRVLWAGNPDVLPLDGWSLGAGLAYGTSRDGPPDATGLWPASDHGATGLLADALQVAHRGETSRLGHLMAPMAVRYVVVPLRAAPAPPGVRPPPRSRPGDLLGALSAQIDLKLIDSDDSLVVYENAAWGPARAVLPTDAVPGSQGSGLDAARTTELRGSQPALTQRSATHFTGSWPGGELFVSEAYSSRWRFRAGGQVAPHRKAFGWANAYSAEPATSASLRYRTSPLRYLALFLQVCVWALVVRVLVRDRRAGRAAAGVTPR